MNPPDPSLTALGVPGGFWSRRPERLVLTIQGPDRHKFLHNLTTNDIKALAVGHGCEAFVTSPRGKILAFVTVLASPDALTLRTDSPIADALLAHLGKYGVFDDVSWDDPGTPADLAELHVAGPRAHELLTTLLPVELELPSTPLEHREAALSGGPARIIREDLTARPGWTILAPAPVLEALATRLDAAAPSHDAGPLDAPAFDALRIEGGTPRSGIDATEDNLPQELDRDTRAISLTKGCYLGQETVARLDAMGHVNRLFRGLSLDSARIPPARTPLLAPDGKPAGHITSAARGPGRNHAIGLGYVRVAHAAPGQTLHFEADGSRGSAIVQTLPFPPGE
jgi:folate-binding protein YgfZ